MTEEAQITQMLNDYFAALQTRASEAIAAHWHPAGTLFINGEPHPRAALTDAPPTATIKVQTIRHIEAHPPLVWAEVYWHLLVQGSIERYHSLFVLTEDMPGQWRITHQADQETEKTIAALPPSPTGDEPKSITDLQTTIEDMIPPELMGLKAEVTPQRLHITWPESSLAPLTLFLALVIFLNMGEITRSITPWVAPFWGSVFTLSVVYAFLAMTFNKARLELNTEQLQISHGPIFPFPTKKTILVSDIRQVYIQGIAFGSRYSSGIKYRVTALTHQQTHEEVITLSSERHVLFIETAIEQYLGIPDEVVRGEWRSEPYLYE